MMRWLRQPIGVVLLLLCVTAAQAIDFILPDLDGRDRSLAEFRGKWLLVNFVGHLVSALYRRDARVGAFPSGA